MVITIVLSEEERIIAEAYSKHKGVSVSEVIKAAFFEKVEDEYDINVASKVLKEYKNYHETYSLNRIRELLKIK